jgi:hypothetical protein
LAGNQKAIDKETDNSPPLTKGAGKEESPGALWFDNYTKKGDTMPVSDAQKRASAKYDKENIKRATVIFSPQELELYEHLVSQPNKSGYIKDLIRQDMEHNS